jgi:hypothetical protein
MAGDAIACYNPYFWLSTESEKIEWKSRALRAAHIRLKLVNQFLKKKF